MSIEIIGQGLDVAIDELAINATKTYESKASEYSSKYQVWELSESEYEKLSMVKDKDWEANYGWWRNGGCNHPLVFTDFTVKSQLMKGFTNEYSSYYDQDCEVAIPNYASFSEWFSEYMGLSKPENLAYFAHSLAKHNNLSITNFLKKFEG